MSSEFKFNVIEFLGSVDEKEGWGKSMARIAWGDNASTIDIRHMNIKAQKFGKGISLTDEEAEAVAEILVSNDYGSIETLEKALLRKKKRFMLNVPDTIFTHDNKLDIDIK